MDYGNLSIFKLIMDRIKRGDLVVASVEEIHSSSVELKLVEYNLKGFLNVSNIPGLWIRDLKKNIKKNQMIIGKVIHIDHLVEISLKGISRSEKERRLKDYGKETKAIRLFERISNEYKISPKKIENEISLLKQNYGGVFETLALIRKGEKINFSKEFSELAERFKTGEKFYEIKGEIELHSERGDGVDLIKNGLSGLKNIESSYKGNTRFLLKLKTTNPKKGEKNLVKEAEKVISKIKSKGGSGEFKLL